jgi:hypothetical protein
MSKERSESCGFTAIVLDPSRPEEFKNALNQLTPGMTQDESNTRNQDELESRVRDLVTPYVTWGDPDKTISAAGAAASLRSVADEISPPIDPNTLPDPIWHPKFGPWNVEVSPEGQYLYIDHEDHPGDIHIKADIDGFVVDVWDSDKHAPAVAASIAVEYVLLENYSGPEPLVTPAPGEDTEAPQLPQYLIVEFPVDCGEDVESLAKDLGEMLENAQTGAALHGPFDDKDNQKLKDFIEED